MLATAGAFRRPSAIEGTILSSMGHLHVVAPCTQSWEAMSGRDGTRHCDVCDKQVHDLRGMSKAEALSYVRARRGASLCVRLLVTTAVAACGAPPARAPSAPAPVASAAQPAPVATADGDRDHDGIADQDDACPEEPGVASTDPHKNGCPQFVALESMGALIILQQVHFARGSRTVMAESFPIIDETIQAMQANPQLRHVAIEGHASNDEPGAQALSEARAKAVLARMTAAGIDPKRLVMHGFGSTRPVDDNKTNEGRERNRRVEFRIVQDGEPTATGDASCSPGSPSGRSSD
jgi:outer membrane protein OmpA-like peptidoglycan-associated protein